MKIVRLVVISILFSAFTIACSDDICNTNTEALLGLEINVTDSTLISSNYTDGLFIFSPKWTDSIQYSVQTADSIVLSPIDAITSLIFASTMATEQDTLIIYHQNTTRFLSPECGFVIDYKIDSIPSLNSWNLIDSVKIVNSNISNDEKGLIQIYF